MGCDGTDADQQEEAEAQGEKKGAGAGEEPLQEGLQRRRPCKRRGPSGSRDTGRRTFRQEAGALEMLGGQGTPLMDQHECSVTWPPHRPGDTRTHRHTGDAGKCEVLSLELGEVARGSGERWGQPGPEQAHHTDG